MLHSLPVELIEYTIIMFGNGLVMHLFCSACGVILYDRSELNNEFDLIIQGL